MNPIEKAKDSVEQAQAVTDARLEKSRREKGLPTWLATIIDVATLVVCVYLVVGPGGLWIIPAILFGVIALLELGNRTIEWINA